MPPTRAVDWWAEHHAADLVGNSARLPSYFNNLPQNLFTKASIHHAHIIALAYGWLSVTRANRVRVSISENFSNVVEPNTQENHIEQSSVDARNPTTVDEGHRDELEQKGKAEESNESSLVTVLDSSPEKGGSKAIEITSIRVNLAGLYLEAVTEGTKKSVGWTDKTDDGQNLSCTSTNRESIQCPSDGSGYPLGGERPKVNDDSRDSSHVHEQVQRVNILRSLGLVPIEDPLPPKKKKKNKKRKAPERESSNIDTDQGKDMAGVGNGKLRAGDPTSGGSRFDRWISATSALNAVHDQIMATANFRLTPMASAFTTFDVTTAKSTRTRQSDFSTTAGEGAGGSSFNGRSSADNIQVIKRKSIGSSSKAGKRTSGVSQGGSTSDGVQKGDIGNSGVRGGKDKENETNSAVDSHKAIRKGAMEKEGLVALKDAELRMNHGCEIIYSSGLKPNLEHPNHHRVWTANNLWCGNCTERCALCFTSCCTHSRALFVYQSSFSTMDQKTNAQQILTDIQHWNPTGKEENTFLTCTDCNRLVCPNCCGICPHPVCHDLICKKCKLNPWALCDWHDQ